MRMSGDCVLMNRHNDINADGFYCLINFYFYDRTNLRILSVTLFLDNGLMLWEFVELHNLDETLNLLCLYDDALQIFDISRNLCYTSSEKCWLLDRNAICRLLAATVPCF
jgi:hypothetical protein